MAATAVAARRGHSRSSRTSIHESDDAVAAIRILLVGVPRMLHEIISATIAAEPGMVIAGRHADATSGLGALTQSRRIDVIVFRAGDEDFAEDRIERLLRTNPRLGLLAVDGPRDAGTLHHLVAAHEVVRPLSETSLAAAIRAAAALRRR